MQNTKNWIVVASGLLAVGSLSLLVVDKAYAQTSDIAPQAGPRQGGGFGGGGSGNQVPPMVNMRVDHVVSDQGYLYLIHGHQVTKIDKNAMTVVGRVDVPPVRLGGNLPGTPDQPVRRGGGGIGGLGGGGDEE